MSALLGKAGKKLFEQHLDNYAPADPLYEFYTDGRGRQKRRKRDLPPGLSARDAAILRSVKRRAHYLDRGFNLCGVRFGWTFFISLVPVIGDLADASLNYYLVVRKARQADLPPWLVSRMLLNNAISLGVSFVPFVGDVVLAVFKANSRNAALLEEFLRVRGQEYLKLHPEEVAAVDGAAAAKRTKSGRWFGKKSTVGVPVPTGDLNPKDREQVKPGAGMRPGETAEQVTIVEDPQVYGEGEGGVPTSATQVASSSSSGGRSFSSMFGAKKNGNGNKSGTVENNNNNMSLSPNPPQGDRQSRFVENVSAASSAAASTQTS